MGPAPSEPPCESTTAGSFSISSLLYLSNPSLRTVLQCRQTCDACQTAFASGSPLVRGFFHCRQRWPSVESPLKGRSLGSHTDFRLCKLRLRSWMMSQSVLQVFIESETQQILDKCTTCGKCVEVCPMLPYGDLQGADSKHVVSGILDILRGGQGHAEARRWAQVCTASGSCIPACPEGINPRKMLNLAKHTLKSRERVPQPAGDTYFKRMAQSIRLLVGTQMMPDQYRRLSGLSAGMKSRAEVIFYLGCNVLRTPHIVFNVMDILDAIAVDYEVLGGVNNCCGIVHFRTQGDLGGSDRIESHTLQHFAEFQPQVVLTWCPSCQLHLGETTAGATKLAYTLEHITQFPADHVDELRRRFVKAIPKRVALHEHNGIAGINDNVRTLLTAIPGLELVDIEQLAEPGYTCGGGRLRVGALGRA